MSSRPEDSRPDDETKLDAWTAPSPSAEAEPSGSDEAADNESCAPDGSVDGLAEIFHDIVGEYETVEEQEETPSHDPIEGEFDVDLTDDGLDDAADSDLIIGGWK